MAARKQYTAIVAGGAFALAALILASPSAGGSAQDNIARIRAGDRLHIRASSLPGNPINGVYKVEPSGKVPLGGPYGRFQITGLTPEDAEAKIRSHLAATLKDPQVSLTWYDPVAHGNKELLERVTKLEMQVEALQATLAKRKSP
jgi:protein involved in polysaccharide export with SLBB domain